MTSLERLPRHAWIVLRTFLTLKHPFSFLLHYARRDWPIEQPVCLRDGLKILLSNPEDIVTLVEVFLRRQYGTIRPGAVVLDIGANIGVFTLFALSQGASRVYAFEPSTSSFDQLLTNIRLNDALDRVHAVRIVVSGRAGEMVKFPVTSSRENAVIVGDTNEQFSLTPTTTLEGILDEHTLPEVDLVKLDCEGAERNILLETRDSLWPRLHELRLEFHYDGDKDLRPFLHAKGFSIVKHEHTGGAGDGMIWGTRLH